MKESCARGIITRARGGVHSIPLETEAEPLAALRFVVTVDKNPAYWILVYRSWF